MAASQDFSISVADAPKFRFFRRKFWYLVGFRTWVFDDGSDFDLFSTGFPAFGSVSDHGVDSVELFVVFSACAFPQ